MPLAKDSIVLYAKWKVVAYGPRHKKEHERIIQFMIELMALIFALKIATTQREVDVYTND